MGPFPPTGKRVEGPFLSFLRIEDGKIAEMWVEWDNLSMLTQLGHLPPPGPTSDAVAEVLADFEAAWNGDPGAAAELVTDDIELLRWNTMPDFVTPDDIRVEGVAAGSGTLSSMSSSPFSAITHRPWRSR